MPSQIKLCIKYVGVQDTDCLGFSVIACRDIAAGEEIFVNYGARYFEEEPDGCPCLTCKPVNTDGKKDGDFHIQQPFDTGARQTANRTKRARQAENRKKGRLMTG
jgi:hypothetical protein